MKYFPVILITAICGIVVIEVVALMNGIDGTMLAASYGAIGTLIGVTLDHYYKKLKLELEHNNKKE